MHLVHMGKPALDLSTLFIMVKRIGNLWNKIVNIQNIELAFDRAVRGKSNRRNVRRAKANKEKIVKQIYELLKSGNYKTSEYKTKKIYEPKERTIYILPLVPDRIVHHAIMNVLEPIWDARLINNTYSCRLGKGQHKGSQKVMQYIKYYKFVLKNDISKFYPSINHEILKQVIRRKIKDERVLQLLDGIIDSVEGESNVPIGNYLSQWFGNLYMDSLDRYITQELGFKAYIRYCDDFIVFSESKHRLSALNQLIKEFIHDKLKLKLSRSSIFNVSRGIDFLGYRHFPSYILIRKSTVKRMKRRLLRIPYQLKHKIITMEQAVSKLASFDGWTKHANCHNLKSCEWFVRLQHFVGLK